MGAKQDPLKSVPPLEWVKPPQQQRSQRTFERILDAAEDFIIEHGVQALTVSAVVAKAKSSVGAFYARFPDKSALLSTLHERDCEEALATTDAVLDPARWEGIELPEAIEAIVQFVVQVFFVRQRLVLAFVGTAASDETFAARRARLHAHIAQRLHRLLESRAEEIPHPDLSLAADIAVRMLLGTLESEMSLYAALSSAGTHEIEKLSTELTRALLGYFGIPVSRRVPAARSSSFPEGESR